MGIAAFIVTAPFAKPLRIQSPRWVISRHQHMSA